MTADAFVLDGVTKRYGAVHCARTDVFAGVRRGEMFGLIGPDGAGKTTAIRLGVRAAARRSTGGCGCSAAIRLRSTPRDHR